MNAVTVRDNPELGRFELSEDGTVLGFAEYQLHDGVVSFTHTEIDPAQGGRGLGKHLVTAALDDVGQRGLQVRPFCPYVRKVIAENAEAYLRLVPAADRGRFDLPETD